MDQTQETFDDYAGRLALLFACGMTKHELRTFDNRHDYGLPHICLGDMEVVENWREYKSQTT